MTDNTPAQTSEPTLQTATTNLVVWFDALSELRNLDSSELWRLTCGLMSASRAYAMHVANDKAYTAAYAAAERLQELDVLLATLTPEAFIGLYREPYRPMAQELLTAVKADTLEWRRSHGVGGDVHTRACEHLAQLLHRAFEVLAVYGRYDDFRDLFSDDENLQASTWLDEAALAMTVWAEARDYRNQIKTALRIE